MGKLVVVEFMTLDGVMQSPTDTNEDRSGGDPVTRVELIGSASSSTGVLLLTYARAS